MRRGAIGAVLGTLIGLAAFAGPAPAAADTVLPIPNPLTRDWVAPSGTFAMPKVVVVRSAVTVDLSAATITGTTGYLFSVRDGARLTVLGGTVSGALQGLVLDAVSDTRSGAAVAAVTVDGTTLSSVRSIVYSKVSTGPIDVTLRGVRASGLGDGVRAVTNALVVSDCVLTGGGEPPDGEPAGLHSLDDTAGNVGVAASTLDVRRNTITGFTSKKFQGDSILGETRVGSAYIANNRLGHNSDSGGIDSKMARTTFVDNVVQSDGYRAVASHYGSLSSSGNTIYQNTARLSGGRVGQVYQATGGLTATDDTVVMVPGALLANALYTATRDGGPASTYPRVGAITLTHITDADATVLTGPTTVTTGPGYTPTIVVNP